MGKKKSKKNAAAKRPSFDEPAAPAAEPAAEPAANATTQAAGGPAAAHFAQADQGFVNKAGAPEPKAAGASDNKGLQRFETAQEAPPDAAAKEAEKKAAAAKAAASAAEEKAAAAKAAEAAKAAQEAEAAKTAENAAAAKAMPMVSAQGARQTSQPAKTVSPAVEMEPEEKNCCTMM